jgi:hypothetical protein
MGGQAFDIGMFGDIATLRDFISVTKKNMTASHAPVPGVKEEKDHQITMRDGEKITVRTYTPEKTGGPLYVMYHGGGWCIGGLENEELLCRLLCGQLGFVAVNVDYRLAPEHTFPTAHNDCWDATKWVSLNFESNIATRSLTQTGRLQRLPTRRRPQQRLHSRWYLSRRQYRRHDHSSCTRREP